MFFFNVKALPIAPVPERLATPGMGGVIGMQVTVHHQLAGNAQFMWGPAESTITAGRLKTPPAPKQKECPLSPFNREEQYRHD